MSPRKPASQELTREMILSIARIQFSEKDFEQVSMRAIAKELGCTHGSLYYHFKNKAELFYAIVEESFHVLNKRLEETLNDPQDHDVQLYLVYLRFIEFGLDHQSQYELMFMKKNAEVDSLCQEAATTSYQKFAHAVDSLSVKTLTAQEIYSSFIALHGFVSHHIGYVSNFEEAKEEADAYVQFILKAINKALF
ncbi:TetR/AcrR family transcriptional regulator [Bacillus sp. AK128]